MCLGFEMTPTTTSGGFGGLGSGMNGYGGVPPSAVISTTAGALNEVGEVATVSTAYAEREVALLQVEHPDVPVRARFDELVKRLATP